MRLSVIIPAFNEAKRLPDTLEEIFSYLGRSGWDTEAEVIVIDDGSTDETALQVTSRTEKNLRLIKHGRNLGKGAAIRTGALEAAGENILFLDADYSTNLEELDRFLTKLRQGYDVVIGSRAVIGSRVLVPQNWLKVLLGRAGNLAMRLLLGLNIKDSQCGFKLFSAKAKKLFERQTLFGWGFDFEILFLAKKSGLRVAELPVTWINSRQSKVKPFDYFKTLGELIKIKINDLRRL